MASVSNSAPSPPALHAAPAAALHGLLRSRLRSFPDVLQAHAHLLSSGLLSRDPVAAGLLLHASAAHAPLRHTVPLLVRHLPPPVPLFALNAALRAVSLRSRSLPLPFFSSLLRFPGFVPDSFTFPPLLSACARAAALPAGEQLHGQSLRRGVHTVLHVRNALIHFYARCGRVVSARDLFDEMLTRDFVSWNAMVDGYIISGDLTTARELFDNIPRRNTVSWNVMIGGYVKERCPESALEVFREMTASGLRGNATTMVSAVTACARLGRLNAGREVHGFFLRNIVEDNLVFWTALVDMYGKCRRVDIARKVFDGVQDRNLICWNTMIVGHCVYGDPEDGLKLFYEMIGGGDCLNVKGDGNTQMELQSRILPDEVTFVGVLCACARAGLEAEGKRHFLQMTSLYDLKPTFAHYWCLANLYGNLGLVQHAEEVLRSMPEETISLALGGLLGLCRFQGELELGERIALRLIELDPHNGCYHALLCSVYVAAHKWDDAQKLKIMMKGRGERFRPGHRLVDLNEIVHNFQVGDRSQPETDEVYAILDNLATRLRLGGGNQM